MKRDSFKVKIIKVKNDKLFVSKLNKILMMTLIVLLLFGGCVNRKNEELLQESVSVENLQEDILVPTPTPSEKDDFSTDSGISDSDSTAEKTAKPEMNQSEKTNSSIGEAMPTEPTIEEVKPTEPVSDKIEHIHTYNQMVIDSTCTEKGYIQHTCSVCGDSYKDAEKAANGHDYTIKTVSPTCTEKGYTQHTCSVCGDSYKNAEIAAFGHTCDIWVVKKIPTYIEAGMHQGVCSTCNMEVNISLGCLVRTDESIQQEILRLVNIERERAGVAMLKYNDDAQIAVDARVQDLQLIFSHTRPDGSSCFEVLNDYNINSGFILGENIAFGYRNAESVMNAWMNSPGHKSNILNENYKYIAIGECDYGWAQMFFG